MTKVVMTHVGSDLPAYIRYAFQQLRTFNPADRVEILLIAGNEYLKKNQKLLNQFGVTPVPYEDFQTHPLLQEFVERSWYKAWGTPNTKYPGPPNFVQGTSERLYALNAFLEASQFEDVIHIENDIMIYCELPEIVQSIKLHYDKFTATEVGPDYISCGLCYIPKPECLNDICEFMMKFIRKGNDWIKRHYPSVEMAHEMTLLRLNEDIQYLPILPNHELTHVFDALFDPASWGQWLGGTNTHAHGEGYAGAHHYIGRELLAGKYVVQMLDGIPHVVSTERKIDDQIGTFQLSWQLLNLHVHCKRLERFLTEP
jgi:hypothetical protein